MITTVVLTLTPAGGGSDLVFQWADPENDGSPVIDEVVLPDASADAAHAPQGYSLALSFLNELEEPAEDITAEVADESDQHQVFITGDGVQGPATGANASALVEHTYEDTDANGLPVGLDNTLTTLALGAGELIVTLRHLPPEDEQAVKVAELADKVASEGFGAIGGDNDAQVTFPLTVE